MAQTYNTKHSSKFLFKIHLIFVCKYRKKLLINLGSDCKQIMLDISKVLDFRIDTMEIDKDHIHFILDIDPKISISSIVNRLKSISTNRLWKKYENFLKKHFWKERTFWSDGYFSVLLEMQTLIQFVLILKARDERPFIATAKDD